MDAAEQKRRLAGVTGGPRASRRPWSGFLAYGVVVAGAVLWAHLSTSGPSSPADSGPSDAAAVVAQADTIWTAQTAGIARFDRASPGRPVVSVRLQPRPTDLAVTSNGALIVSAGGIQRLDPRTLRPLGPAIAGSGGSWQLAPVGPMVAAVARGGQDLLLIDPSRNAVRWRVRACREGALDVGADNAGIWVTCRGKRIVGRAVNNPAGVGEVAVVAAADGRRVVGPRLVGIQPIAIAVGGSVAWVADPQDRTLTGLGVDPPFVPTITLPMAATPVGVAVGDWLWVATRDPARV